MCGTRWGRWAERCVCSSGDCFRWVRDGESSVGRSGDKEVDSGDGVAQWQSRGCKKASCCCCVGVDVFMWMEAPEA